MLPGMFRVFENPRQKLASILELHRSVLLYRVETEVLMEHPPVSTPFRCVAHEAQVEVPSHPALKLDGEEEG